MRLLRLFRRKRRDDEVWQRPIDTTDALTTARANQSMDPHGAHGSMPPPGYVRSYDDGRPRK